MTQYRLAIKFTFFIYQNQPKGAIDDTAVNAVKLYCSNADHHDTGYITSTQGHKGDWVGKYDFLGFI